MQWTAALIFVASLAMQAADARFYRVSGPVNSVIVGLDAHGYLTWMNETTNATFTIQTTGKISGDHNWMDYVQILSSNRITTSRLFDPNSPMGMTLIPAGSFTMGDNLDGDIGGGLPLHCVCVSAFYIDRTEVTKELWDDVYNWATNHGYCFENDAAGKAGNHPAQSMTWYDAVKWCNARSEKEDRVPTYYTNNTLTGIYRYGQVDVSNECVNWNSGYRLPTEAEWEKAARGGAIGQRFALGNTISHSNANYYSASEPYDSSITKGFHPSFNDGIFPYTSPVGFFAPNGYGLYDMAGNVWEWCWDWYGPYSPELQSDPCGPSSGSLRVFRGGGWFSRALFCRAAFRYYYNPTETFGNIGFRSVLPARQ